jgi:hypothetical protein
MRALITKQDWQEQTIRVLCGLLGLVQRSVTALGELLERVFRAQLREAYADRRARPGPRERGCYRLKPAVSVLGHALSQRADELVTPDADDRVIGAQVRLDRGYHVAKQRVARGMA